MTQSHRLLIGSLATAWTPPVPSSGPAGLRVIDLGTDHPTHAGLLEIDLTTAAGRVTSAEPVIGAMHRGVEKLFEVRDYRQILMLANRHDWQAPFIGELAAAQLFEQMMGLPVPPRAAAVRVLLTEHARIAGHLALLGWLARRVDHTDHTDHHTAVRAARETLREVAVRFTGNRIHPMVTRLGGLAVDPAPADLDALVAAADQASAAVRFPVPDDLRGVTPVPAGAIDAWGLSGPLARSAGDPRDLRRADPGYADVVDLLPSPGDAGLGGDAGARFAWMMAEVAASARMIARLAPQVPAGPVGTKLPKIVKLPEGSGHHLIEGPLGRTGFRVVSRGQKTPWRLKLRSPSFQHVAALSVLLPGTAEDQVEAALASIGWVIGDVDK